jgi:hypothetical protein
VTSDDINSALMDLDQQIQALATESPDDGVTGAAITAIAPTLKTLATQLKHLQYYVLQTLNQDWVMLTINNRQQANTAKNVVYAFPSLQDVAKGPYSVKDPQVMGVPVPVIHILFKMLAMKPVDSIIFFETPGNTKQGIEVRRDDLQTLVQKQLQQNQGTPTSNIPPDIA